MHHQYQDAFTLERKLLNILDNTSLVEKINKNLKILPLLYLWIILHSGQLEAPAIDRKEFSGSFQRFPVHTFPSS